MPPTCPTICPSMVHRCANAARSGSWGSYVTGNGRNNPRVESISVSFKSNALDSRRDHNVIGGVKKLKTSFLTPPWMVVIYACYE